GAWHAAWQRIRSSLPWIVGIAFGLRVLCIVVMHTYRVRTTEDNFGFGWEMGRIAASIASGHGFANPFQTPTGPTAWEPPLTPYLMAGVFKIFGIYSHASAFVLLTINSLWSALTCIPIFLVARRSFGEAVAVASAWTWALFPYVIYWDIKWMWETSLSALLITTIFWLAVSMEDTDGVEPWLRFGLLWGVPESTAVSPSSSPPPPGLYAWSRRGRAARRSVAGV